MGKRYAKRDNWSERTNFAFIIEEWSAMKSNSWGISTSGDGAAPAVGAGGDGSSSAEAGGKAAAGTGGKAAAGTAEVPAGGKAAAKAAGKAQPRDRTSLEKSIASASSVKTAYNATVGQAELLLDAFKGDPDYVREKDAYGKELGNSVKELRKVKDSDALFKKFIVMDVADVRKAYPTADALSTHCMQLKKTLEGPFASTQRLAKTISAVVRARLSVANAQPPAKEAKTGRR